MKEIIDNIKELELILIKVFNIKTRLATSNKNNRTFFITKVG